MEVELAPDVLISECHRHERVLYLAGFRDMRRDCIVTAIGTLVCRRADELVQVLLGLVRHAIPTLAYPSHEHSLRAYTSYDFYVGNTLRVQAIISWRSSRAYQAILTPGTGRAAILATTRGHFFGKECQKLPQSRTGFE